MPLDDETIRCYGNGCQASTDEVSYGVNVAILAAPRLTTDYNLFGFLEVWLATDHNLLASPRSMVGHRLQPTGVS